VTIHRDEQTIEGFWYFNMTKSREK
jgi:hypothetical protein